MACKITACHKSRLCTNDQNVQSLDSFIRLLILRGLGSLVALYGLIGIDSKPFALTKIDRTAADPSVKFQYPVGQHIRHFIWLGQIVGDEVYLLDKSDCQFQKADRQQAHHPTNRSWQTFA